MHERSPGSGASAFLSDNENEILAMLEDIPFDYVRREDFETSFDVDFDIDFGVSEDSSSSLDELLSEAFK